MKVTKTLSLNNFIVRLASLGAVWQQGVIPQEQTTRWTGGYDCILCMDLRKMSGNIEHFHTISENILKIRRKLSKYKLDHSLQ
ncbi:hypothetical protein NYE70_14985 [Paenibacillus sp. FSL R5-0407]|uniref:hypothetical protein n=1 Tax=Paenibacillus sp. FSL R5-0407 TaxID=2975320 RepID=UPI0030FB6703